LHLTRPSTTVQRRFFRSALVLTEALLALLIAQPSSLSAASEPPPVSPFCETVLPTLRSHVANWTASPLVRMTPTAAPTTPPAPVAAPPAPTPSPIPQPSSPPDAPTQTTGYLSGEPASPTAMPPPATPTPIPAEPPVAPPPATSICGQRLIPIINQARSDSGLPPLVENPLLTAAAQQFAEFIALYGIFSHTADGRTLDARVEAAGYFSWRALGENLAEGYATSEEAVAAWLASDGHRANILNPSFTETGVGCASNAASPYGYFWVQEFGSR